MVRKVVASEYAAAERLWLHAAVTHDDVGVATGPISLVRREFLVIRAMAR